MNTVVNKALEVAKEIYNNSIIKLTDKLVKKNVDNLMQDIDNDTLKYYKLEREKDIKNFRSEQIYDMI